VNLIHLVVMRGLDPRIHHLLKRWCEADGPAGQARGWRIGLDASIQNDRYRV